MKKTKTNRARIKNQHTLTTGAAGTGGATSVSSQRRTPWSVQELLKIPRERWLLPLLFALLVFAVYIPALNGGYIWDDNYYVTENMTLRSLRGLQAIWGDMGATPQYYPLVFTTFWIEYHLWGLQAFGYHFDNVLLHVLNSLLLWVALRRLRLPGAGLAALVFATHPVNVESVAWITERKNVLSGFFYLLSLLACLHLFRLGEDPDVHAPPSDAIVRTRSFWPLYALAFFLFCCALLSKTVTCSLPAVVLLLLWWQRGRFGWRELLLLAPFFAIGLIMAFVTVHMEINVVGATGAEWSLTLVERCLVAGRVLWFYLGKIVLPYNLTFIYPRWEINQAAAWQYLFPVAAVALAAVLWLLRRRLTRAPLAAGLFFVMTLTPALGFFNLYPMQYSFVADHFQYLAAIGPITLFVGLAAVGLRRLNPSPRQAGRMAGAAVVALLCVLTWHQCGIYKDLDTLWIQNLEVNPESWMAHNNLGMNLAQRGEIDQAMLHFREALRLHRQPRALNNMANVLAMQGNKEEALECFRQAIDLEPKNPTYYVNGGRLLVTMGRRPEAIAHFRKALTINPRYLDGLNGLGDTLLEEQEWDEAKTVFQQAVKSHPSSINARFGLANALAGSGRLEEAVKYYQQVVDLQPSLVEAHLLLGQTLVKLKRSAEALAEYRLVMRLQPTWSVANAIAWILATDPDNRLRNGTEALSLAEKACRETREIDPGALDTLAAAYAEVARFSDAIHTAQKAIEAAQAAGEITMVQEFQTHLQAYQAGRPYREKY
jgi:protein O-mannosyl-transferase